MNISYLRDVSHCEVTTYARDVTIKSITPALNTDNLVILKFNEIGWQVVGNINSNYNVGDIVFFIPVESVLPFELSEELGITKYLSKGKVKVAKFKYNVSEGLICDKHVVEPYLPYIMKWEDVPTIQMNGDILSSSEVPFTFEVFYKMPNILNEPDTFKEFQSILYSEKIHGTNCRFGLLEHPITGQPTLYIGSHNTVHKIDCNSLYVTTVKEYIKDKVLPLNVIFYGEIYGRNIQHLDYGECKPKLKIFATSAFNVYFTPDETINFCKSIDLECVEFIDYIYDIDKLIAIANMPSTVSVNDSIREGIVIRDKFNGSLMGKLISTAYLEKSNRTERK